VAFRLGWVLLIAACSVALTEMHAALQQCCGVAQCRAKVVVRSDVAGAEKLDICTNQHVTQKVVTLTKLNPEVEPLC
jgi:hypothetical protein